MAEKFMALFHVQPVVLDDPELLATVTAELMADALEQANADIAPGGITIVGHEPMVQPEPVTEDGPFPDPIMLWMFPDPKPEPDFIRITASCRAVRR